MKKIETDYNVISTKNEEKSLTIETDFSFVPHSK